MKVIGGLDDYKESIHLANVQKLASYNRRVELASQFTSDLKIQDDKGYAIYAPGTFEVSGLIDECLEKYKRFYEHKGKKVGGKRIHDQ